MSNASFTSRPLGTAMVGGAIAMATLDILVQKNVLTVDDVQAVLKTAQSSLVNSPRVYGSLDGARIIGEIKDIFARRERGHWNERPDERPLAPPEKRDEVFDAGARVLKGETRDG